MRCRIQSKVWFPAGIAPPLYLAMTHLGTTLRYQECGASFNLLVTSLSKTHNQQKRNSLMLNGLRIPSNSSSCGVASDHVSVSWPHIILYSAALAPHSSLSLARLQAQLRPAWLRLRHRRPAWPGLSPPPHYLNINSWS